MNPEQKQKRKVTLMKKRTALRASALIGTGAVLGFLLNAVIQWPSGIVETRASAEEKPTLALAVTNAPSAPSTNNGPDQSHAMVDVGYHFANLWFAADKGNWPLAKYYLQGRLPADIRGLLCLPHGVRKAFSAPADPDCTERNDSQF